MPGNSLCRIPDPILHPAPKKIFPPRIFSLPIPPSLCSITGKMVKKVTNMSRPSSPNILDYPIQSC